MAPSAISTPITSALAEFVVGFRAEDVPRDVLDRTVTLVLDGSGALLAAANPLFSTGRLIAGFAADQGGREQAAVIGHGFRTSTVTAALANGTMGYACDIEPHHPEGVLHPIAVMLPTALAVAERVAASGTAFLAAIVLGCEIEYRLSMALGPVEQYDLGFHPSAICGCFGATAAAAYLLGLDAEQVARAFGLAGCQASGLMAWESDPTENSRPFQMGVAARNGVTAALLAASGFGGPNGIFDTGHTVFRAFSRAGDPGLLTDGLGTRWDGIMEVAIKPYSSVSFLHPGLDALLELAREHDLTTANVQAMVLRFASSGVHCIDGNPLKSHCAQYILPVALSKEGLSIADLFIDRRSLDEDIATLSRHVTVVKDDELDKLFPDRYPTVIEVVTRSGERLTRRKDIARGYPEAPLDDREIRAKFERLAGTVASPERVRALQETIHQLPSSSDLQCYAVLMGGKPDVLAEVRRDDDE